METLISDLLTRFARCAMTCTNAASAIREPGAMRSVVHCVIALGLMACGNGTEVEVPSGNTTAQQYSPVSSTTTIERLDNNFFGPAFDSETTAIDATLDAVRNADQLRLQEAWSRMQPAQKLAANDAVRDWVKNLEDEEFARIAATYEHLNRVDWAAVHAQNEADKATAGLEFGNLHGIVVDPETNAPVEGMTISAAHAEYGLGPKMLASTVQAVTDADGSFELTHIPTGEINIVGLLPTYTLPNATAQIVAGQTVQQTYKATRLVTPKIDVLFAGEVVDAVTGKPIASARVFLNKRVTRTKANGRFILDTQPGSYTVRVEHTDYQTLEAEITTPASGAFRQDYALQPDTMEAAKVPQ